MNTFNSQELYQIANVIEKYGEEMSHTQLLKLSKGLMTLILPMVDLFEKIESLSIELKAKDNEATGEAEKELESPREKCE